jgi:hypothetical protein
MKLKLAVLVAAAFGGAGASVALADHGGDHGQKCKAVHVSGTLAAASLSLTSKAGTTVSLALPAGARAKGEACTDGTTFTLRHLEVEVKAPKPAPSGTTQTTQTTTTSTTP